MSDGSHLAVVVVLITAFIVGCTDSRRERHQEISTRLTPTMLLAGDPPEGLARIAEPLSLSFPTDHGPHPDYRTEWWYFTGNLRAGDGRRFGIQLTFFRFALAASSTGTDRQSGWATRQAWMGHFAVTDVGDAQHYAFERFARGALDLAGARAAPFAVWLHAWEARSLAGDFLPLMLRADAGAIALELMLDSEADPVLQGEEGYSRKGPEPGNASAYYSFPALTASGALRIAPDEYEVQGKVWLDREWGTSALGASLVGWDWFALRFDDGSALMYYQLRRRDGGSDRFSGGSLVRADGSVLKLTPADVDILVLERWRSPASGVSYPVRWRLLAGELEFEVEALVEAQELVLSVRYWEGAVSARGTRGGQPLLGEGYVELTGYAAE